LRHVLPAACAVLLLIQLGGCAVTVGENGRANTYTKGQWIKKQAHQDTEKRALAARVVKALEDDPLLRQADIQARVAGHAVTLTGTLYDAAVYRHAIKVVQGVKGVKAVNSRIELRLDQEK
jgi:osmotically-inducible protein OsmY